MCEETKETNNYCVGCLPTEILEKILSYLCVVDYIYIHTVCKCWRAAFHRCRPEVLGSSLSQGKGMLPWFLVLDRDYRRRGLLYNGGHLYTTGKLGDLSTQRIYKMDIPYLRGMRFHLSKYGWLLLQCPESGSLFFLHPFSKARINLPALDLPEISATVFGMSAPPTSSDCNLFVVSYDLDDRKPVLIANCRRGETEWTVMHWFDGYFTGLAWDNSRRSCVTNTVFVSGVWYCVHDDGMVSAFDTTESCWEWRKVSLPDECRETFMPKIVSFVTKGEGQALHLSIHRHRSNSSYELVLDDHEPPVYGSNSRQQEEVEYDLRMSVREAISKLQDSIQMDSFSPYVWCAMLGNNKFLTLHKWRRFKNRSIELMRQGSILIDSLNESDWYAVHRNFQPGDNDEIEFSWHEYSYLPVADRNDDLICRVCLPSSHNSCTAVSWLLPGLVDCSSNLDWSHVGQSS